jgi:hypothetical protein
MEPVPKAQTMRGLSNQKFGARVFLANTRHEPASFRRSRQAHSAKSLWYSQD